MAKTKIKVSLDFKKKIDRAKRAVEEAAAVAMKAGVKFAQEEAKEQARWGAGETNQTDDWEWELTGLARDSIQGLIVSRPLSERAVLQSPRTSKTWNLTRGKRLVWTHQRKAMRFPLPRSKKNLIVAKLIMNPEYTHWLQGKEINGSVSGMSAGQPVVSDVMRKRWRSFIFPQIVMPAFWIELRKRL